MSDVSKMRTKQERHKAPTFFSAVRDVTHTACNFLTLSKKQLCLFENSRGNNSRGSLLRTLSSDSTLRDSSSQTKIKFPNREDERDKGHRDTRLGSFYEIAQCGVVSE